MTRWLAALIVAALVPAGACGGSSGSEPNPGGAVATTQVRDDVTLTLAPDGADPSRWVPTVVNDGTADVQVLVPEAYLASDDEVDGSARHLFARPDQPRDPGDDAPNQYDSLIVSAGESLTLDQTVEGGPDGRSVCIEAPDAPGQPGTYPHGHRLPLPDRAADEPLIVACGTPGQDG